MRTGISGLCAIVALGILRMHSNLPSAEALPQAQSSSLDPDSPEALARAIEHLIRHPDEAQQMGDRGRQAVLREYSWNNEFEKLQAFYEQLL